MGFLKTMLGPKRQETWSPTLGTSGFVAGNSTRVRTSSGEVVTETTALNIPSVFACVRVIGEDVAKIPIKVHHAIETEYGPGFEDARDHPAYDILLNTPNEEMTAFNAKQALVISAALWGNGYAAINRTKGQRLAGYTPLLPWRVKTERTPGGRLQYVHNPGPGKQNEVIKPEDMLHIIGPTCDGLVGWMVVGLGAQAIGVAQAAQKFTSTFFGSGASLKGVVTLPQPMGTEEFAEFVERFRDNYEGAENQNKTAIFDSGATYNPISSTPRDAQMVDTLRYSLEDVARLFRCHPQKLYDRTRAQGWSTLEILNLEHLTDSLMPWTCRIDQEAARKLLTVEERRNGYKIEHDFDFLMVADLQTRAEYFNSGIQNGWLSVNEVRREINRNPVEGGNTYLQPLNMTDAAGSRGDDADDEPIDQDYRPQVRESFAHAMQRVVDREANAARRKASNHDQAALIEWAQSWYPGQADAIRADLGVPARLLAGLVGLSREHADRCVRRYADQHIAESIRMLGEATNVMDELDRWQIERAPWAANALCDEVHP